MFELKTEVRLEADAKQYPILLSNGNKIEEGPLVEAPEGAPQGAPEGAPQGGPQGAPSMHYAVFEDPFQREFGVAAGVQRRWGYSPIGVCDGGIKKKHEMGRKRI
ncbi:hypothetical protein EBH_0014080 [Eimeria brunetti]|uniref:Uncharacterized protein n=1 Tax=Eimeria brunetti TaxID=51314 RepID=U6LEJ2_9EIME|nr:hypothetical protein EBH_0014080 [Eimeria brunetti]